MTPLVVIAGLLALGSGTLKIFGRGGRKAGFSIWALMELVVGGFVPIYALKAPSTPALLRFLLFMTLGLILFSSGVQLVRTRARQRHREETESARLQVWVKYLSRQIEEGEEE